jgi:hypothetical protein
MYMLNATQVNSTLSNQPKSGNVVGVGDVSRYGNELEKVKTRTEECLEIASLSLVLSVDSFEVPSNRRGYTRRHCLRLSNAFLVTDPLQFLFTNHLEETLDYSLEVDHEQGLVWVDLPPGRYRVSYLSGFDVDEDKVFVGLPDWLQSIAKSALNLHYRLTSKVSDLPGNVSYGDLLPAVRQELTTNVNKRWGRPRVDVTFPIKSVRSVYTKPEDEEGSDGE